MRRGPLQAERMSTTTPASWQVQLEDALPYLIPIAVALAGYNWASLIPGDNEAFLTGIAFGFLAKFLIGIQQNGLTSWEDLIPTFVIALTFLAVSFSSNPDYIGYGTAIALVVKALGYFTPPIQSSQALEDLLLAVGAFLVGWGTYVGNAELATVGGLLALIGKTVPSMTTASAKPPPSPAVPAPAPAAAPAPAPAAPAHAAVQLSHHD